MSTDFGNSQLLQDTVAFLRKLISLPSTSCQEKEVAKAIQNRMKEVGFHEAFIDNMGNVIGRIGTGPVKILYDSHIDTVDVGDKNNWHIDPFEGDDQDGIVYGRGASDNKAAIATMVSAGVNLLKEKKLLDQFSVYVCGTVQEEDCDGLAMQYLIENSIPRPDYVVLGECTNLDVYRGHRGRVELKITTSGKSCHASAPERGENAVYKMAPIIKAIEESNAHLGYDEFLGAGSVAVTKIECQTGSLNTVPDACVIYLDRRLTFGETVDKVRDQIQGLPEFKEAGAHLEVLVYDRPSYTGLVVESEKYFPSWALAPEHPLVQAAYQTAREVKEEDVKIDKWVFSTNGIASMGRLNIPTVGYGPSEERFAHSIDDQVSHYHLDKAIQFYSLFPVKLLVLSKGI